LVKLACERHLRDLEHGPARGLVWRLDMAMRNFRFFETVLCFAEGEFAGKPFLLQPWQKFIVGSLFGWYGADGFRRFRIAYIEAANGAGKSPLAAGIGLYGLIADDEPAAQIFSAAVVKDQAKILFHDAELMVAASPALSEHVERRVNNLAVLSTNSYFRPVSSEYRGLEGKRVHMALIDELHEHPSDVVYEKMRKGTKGGRNPLIFQITNSGYDRKSVCWQHHEYSEKVLSGGLENDSWFAYVCQLDACPSCASAGHMMANSDCPDCDDWRDESVWIKANPNLGVSVPVKYLREQVEEALGMPSKRNIVLRLNFCLWTQQATKWLNMEAWAACAGKVDPNKLRGRPCFAGLDLASTSDLCALVLYFPPQETDEPGQALAHFWAPEEAILQRARRDRVPYDLWQQQGYLTATEGNVTDYDVIRRDVNELAAIYVIRELAFDPYNATQLSTQLQGDGLHMVAFRQGFLSMSPAAKELERLLGNKGIAHGDNPVLTWNASNVTVVQDAAGNSKPDKEKSTERIDGIVALVMALGRATVSEGDGRSVYERKGQLAL